MASIQKRSSGWLVRWYDPDGTRRARTCPDRATAQRLALEVERARALGVAWHPVEPGPLPRPALTVAAAAEAWLRARAGALRPRTLVRYGQFLDHLVRVLPAEVHMGNLTRLALEDGLRALPLSPNTVAVAASVWSAFWEWAHDREEYEGLVARPRLLERRETRLAEREVPSDAQVEAMVAGLANPIARRLVVLARWTGGRRAELCALTWADVDLDGLALRFRAETTKGGYGGRQVPIHPRLAAELRAWRPADGAGRVVGPKDLCESQLEAIRAAWRSAGVTPSVTARHTVHILRAWVRTRLVERGVGAELVDLVLGHGLRGTGARHYTDRRRLWGALVAGVAELELGRGAGEAEGAGGITVGTPRRPKVESVV